MKEFYTATGVTVTALVLGLGAAGCGGLNEGPTKVVCQAEAPEQWRPTPANLNTATIAKGLNVSEEQVRSGAYGRAICERSIAPQEVEDTTLLTVGGIGNTCLAIGLKTVEPNRDVLAICAAPLNQSS